MSHLTQEYVLRVVEQLLPQGAELAALDYPVRQPAILAADLDGDRNPEIVAVYRAEEGMRALVAKHTIQGWQVASLLRGPGIGIANLAVAPIAGVYPPTLAIGWKIGERWAQLDLFQHGQGQYRHLTPYDIFYSKLAIEQVTVPDNRDGRYDLALWIHDREEAYQVELLRWEGSGLVRDSEAYPAYYSDRVIPYYARLVKEQPHSGLYRHYWEDARGKSGLTESKTQETADLTVLKSERGKDAELEAAIISAYGLSDGDQGSYAYNRIDLNGDGIPETIVFLSGSSFCGSGGCSAAIFRSEDKGYRLLGKLTLVHTPIVVSQTTTNGYRDLILSVSGGGVTHPVYKRVRFNGVNYPSNPSVEPDLPAGTRLEGSAILADDGSVFSGIPLTV